MSLKKFEKYRKASRHPSHSKPAINLILFQKSNYIVALQIYFPSQNWQIKFTASFYKNKKYEKETKEM